MNGKARSAETRRHPTITSGDIEVERIPLEDLPLPAFVYEIGTLRILAANEAAARAFGYTLAEFASKSLQEIVPEDQIAVVRAALAASAGVADLRGPFRYRTTRGDNVELEAAVSDTVFASRPARLAIVRIKHLAAPAPTASIQTVIEGFENAPLLVWTTDRDLRLSTSVSALDDGFAPSSRASIGVSIVDLSEGLEGGDDALRAHRSALAGVSAEYQIEFSGRHYRCFVDALRDAEHEIAGVVGLAFEISEQINLGRALSTARSTLRVAEETARMGTFEFDVSNGTVAASEAMHDLLDIAPGGLMTGEAFFSRVHPLDRAMVRRAFREARKRCVPFRIEHRIVFEDGTTRWLESSAQPVVDGGGRVVRLRGVATDVTARKEIETELAFLAHHDPLTGLPNRTLLSERLTTAIEDARCEGRVVGVIFMDLDDFKRIGDIYGHDEGDRVIRTCAERLRRCAGPRDTVARVGADEFVIVVGGSPGIDGAVRVVERVQAALAEPIQLGDANVKLRATFGISCYPGDGGTAEQLIGFADMAMFRAKQTRPGEFAYFETALHDAAIERLRLENALSDAIRYGQLEVHYQPIVDAKTRRASGAEALVRWRHPEEGLISPARFIPLAERTGMIVALGELVLRQALRDVAALHWRGFPEMRIAVNVSPRQLLEESFPRMVADALAEAAVPARLLDLEVTESFLVTDPDRAARVLEELASLGVGIALDDFGTGYSALSFLRRFPVHQLKLDRSFVTEIERSRTACAVAATIIELAHTLGMRSLAEGVETRAQYLALDRLECSAFQGYFFARPMVFAQLEEHLRSGTMPPA